MKYSIVLCSLSIFLFSNVSTAQGSDHRSPEKSIVTSTAASENHKILTAAITAADLEGFLNEKGPFTIFAPSDGAFEKLSSYQISTLLEPENKKKLKSLCCFYHSTRRKTGRNNGGH